MVFRPSSIRLKVGHGSRVGMKEGERDKIRSLTAKIGFRKHQLLQHSSRMSASPRVREREIDHDETAAPSAKRQKVENDASSSSAPIEEAGEKRVEASSAPLEATDAAPSAIPEEPESLLPPSHSLLGTKFSSQPSADGHVRILETDVGISEYIAKDVPKIDGIIKQRCALSLSNGDRN